MNETFDLIDLVSQRAAVERLLPGLRDDEKIAWFSVRGRITTVPKTKALAITVYHFSSPAGREATFFLQDGRFSMPPCSPP